MYLQQPSDEQAHAFVDARVGAAGRVVDQRHLAEGLARTEHGERPAEYRAFKAQLEDMMFDMLHQMVPGLRDNVVFSELGTPLTNRYYVAATDGNLYGTEKRRGQIGPVSYPMKTPVDGLWMCGASTIGHGVAGATFSGVMVAQKILGAKKSEILGGSFLRYCSGQLPPR